QEAGGGSEAPDGAPHAERNVALAALDERRRQDRQRRRGDNCRAEALQGTRRDQRRLRPREPGKKRRESEDNDPREEEAPPPEQIGRPAAEQEEPAEDKRVRADHPLQARLREHEVDL